MSYDITERLLHYPRYILIKPIDKIPRYYINHKCIICKKDMMYNQYKQYDYNNIAHFNHIAHKSCVSGKTNHGRMNDTVMIKTNMVNKKQGWKRI